MAKVDLDSLPAVRSRQWKDAAFIGLLAILFETLSYVSGLCVRQMPYACHGLLLVISALMVLIWALRTVQFRFLATPVTRRDIAPEYWDAVHGCAGLAGIAPPTAYIGPGYMGDASSMTTVDGQSGVSVSSAFLRGDAGILWAVTAHEIAHLKYHDTLRAIIISVLMASILCSAALCIPTSLLAFAIEAHRSAPDFTGPSSLLFVGVVTVFLMNTVVDRMFVRCNHRCEYAADAVAAALVGADRVEALLEYLQKFAGDHEGSQTHPSLRLRIEAIRRFRFERP